MLYYNGTIVFLCFGSPRGERGSPKETCRNDCGTARQLPDQSTTLWVESSSISDPRLRADCHYRKWRERLITLSARVSSEVQLLGRTFIREQQSQSLSHIASIPPRRS